MKESSVEFCPVPLEQQPIHEYEQLKDSWFFAWATLEPLTYIRKLIWVWVWGWVIAGPIAAASFSQRRYPMQFALAGALGAALLVALVVLRLYLGWYYVRDRLKCEKIFYEESGWYDGQMWQKPPEMITRDRLIVSYQIDPILARLKKTALILATFIASDSLVWLWL